MAKCAFRYEDQHYDADHDNGPDLRPRSSRYDAPKRTAFMVAWCHGSAGIGLARLRALRLLPERRQELEAGIQRAIRSPDRTPSVLMIETAGLGAIGVVNRDSGAKT